MEKETEFLTPEHRLSGRMDIWAKPGTKIRVVQKSYDGNFPNVEKLEMGKIYTVNFTIVRDCDTKVYLEEIEGFFNSVCFENIGEK